MKRTALSRLGVILVVALVFLSFAGVAGAATDHFTDDNGNIHEANINFIADAGVTVGCNLAGTLYCPGDVPGKGVQAAGRHCGLLPG